MRKVRDHKSNTSNSDFDLSPTISIFKWKKQCRKLLKVARVYRIHYSTCWREDCFIKPAAIQSAPAALNICGKICSMELMHSAYRGCVHVWLDFYVAGLLVTSSYILPLAMSQLNPSPLVCSLLLDSVQQLTLCSQVKFCQTAMTNSPCGRVLSRFLQRPFQHKYKEV